ncbi:acyl carrier protein [Jiella sonneratiae]|uniref:Acyl carrier protein n=1 Tax=Jiella sonneratiae TaxID=2816856 RepID=A0ABS3J179_9HYPH|nr:acyl carrier protein [Jiella sonneratiae]MBO0903408.1 acyl carrier protein [Jiella sonneratiae]
MQPQRAAVTQWISEYLINELDLSSSQIDLDTDFDTYGLDSLEQAVMVGMLEEAFDMEVEVNDMAKTPTINGLVDSLVAQGLVLSA